MKGKRNKKMRSIEIDLMKVEARLDRIQNEARKALGELRKAMDYSNPQRQQTLKRHIKHPYRTDGWKRE